MPATPEEITIPASPGVVEITVEHHLGGSVAVTTVDDETNAVVAACYYVYAGTDVSFNHRIAAGCGTPNGVTRINDLLPGDYLLRQWSSPGGLFLKKEPIPFTIAVGAETPVTVRLQSFPTLVVEIRDQAGSLLAGACFELDATPWNPPEYSVCDADDGDDDGRVVVSRIPPAT